MRSVFSIFFLLFVFFPRGSKSDPRSECRKHKFTDMVVSIQSGKFHRCNGVILNKNTVVTTALCVTDHMYRTQFGSCECGREAKIVYNLRESNLVGAMCAKEIGISKTFIHKLYERYNYWVTYDVAILKTNGDMQLDSDFTFPHLPIVTNSTHTIAQISEMNALVVGYWMNKTQWSPNTQINCLDVTLGNLTECRQKTVISTLPASLTCTFDNNEEINNICKGHYGAPLFVKDRTDGKTMFRGLLSFRPDLVDCKDNTPFFYTRVDYVLPFLNNPEANSKSKL